MKIKKYWICPKCSFKNDFDYYDFCQCCAEDKPANCEIIEVKQFNKKDKEQLARSLLLHIDLNCECDDCLYHNEVMCFKKLISDTIDALLNGG